MHHLTKTWYCNCQTSSPLAQMRRSINSSDKIYYVIILYASWLVNHPTLTYIPRTKPLIKAYKPLDFLLKALFKLNPHFWGGTLGVGLLAFKTVHINILHTRAESEHIIHPGIWTTQEQGGLLCCIMFKKHIHVILLLSTGSIFL